MATQSNVRSTVSPAFFAAIESFVMQKMDANDLFAKTVCNPKKNIEDCITYILNTVQQSGCKGFADDEIYSMAVHYYEEDNIEVGKPRILGEMQKTDVINKEYITREEAASLLNITLPTLHRYAKMDRIRIYKFGSRSLLKTEGLILAIKENKIIKYGRRKYKR